MSSTSSIGPGGPAPGHSSWPSGPREDGAVPSRWVRSWKVPAPLEWAAAMAWRLLLVAIFAYLAARSLVRLRLVVLSLLASLLLISLLGSPVEWLRPRGWPSLVATWTVLAAALVVLARLRRSTTGSCPSWATRWTGSMGGRCTGRRTCPTASSATSPAAWSRSWRPTGPPSSAGWCRPPRWCSNSSARTFSTLASNHKYG
jgi:hypothetical protein